MAVSDGNIGFNDITQELYGRVPQEGDNLQQMFIDAPENGFDPEYDFGAAGPGDAMSEFKNFVKNGTVNGMWDSHTAVWKPYNTENYLQSYFSSRGVALSVDVFLAKGSESTAPFNGPVTATLSLGNVTLEATSSFNSTLDVVYFNIEAVDALETGVYDVTTDLTITLKDAGGYIYNARAITSYQYLHIFDAGEKAYRWKWSSSSIDQYPVIHPKGTWDISFPLSGTHEGQDPPAIVVTISDLAEFEDISAIVQLRSEDGGSVIGKPLTPIGQASDFVQDIGKKISFIAPDILDYQNDVKSMIGIYWEPIITLFFGGNQLTTEVTRGLNNEMYFKVLTETSVSFQWTWTEKSIQIDPQLTDPTEPAPIDGIGVVDTTTGSGETSETSGKTGPGGVILVKDDTIIK